MIQDEIINLQRIRNDFRPLRKSGSGQSGCMSSLSNQIVSTGNKIHECPDDPGQNYKPAEKHLFMRDMAISLLQHAGS